jgi:hypothetical protein
MALDDVRSDDRNAATILLLFMVKDIWMDMMGMNAFTRMMYDVLSHRS